MEQPVQQQVTATRDCPQQIQAQHGPPLDSIPYEDPSSSRQGGQGSARTSLSRASTSSNKSPKAADALPAVHPAGFASEQQRELNLPSILTKASKKKDKQTVGLPPRSISTSSPLTSALRLRRGTRDLGENFQMHMLLGALEGIELDRLDTVQGSTLLEPVSSPKRGEGSPTTRNSVRMQDAFERAKLQADKELVNFRRETTCLLKQHEGEKDQAILHSILSIVGQCLGMTDTDFQETVLRMVDEAEAVRAACTTQQIRVHAANLLFILTRCSRLIVTEDKSLFEKPCYLTVAKTQPRMPRRLSGELESSMTASKESDDGSIYRSRTMPAKALNMMVQRIPSERSPPQSKPPSSLVIRPSDKHSVKGMLGGTKSKKSRRKRGAAWFRAALKPGPSRLGRPSTDDELRSDLQAEMGSPESYEETASAKGTKGFLKSFTARLKDSFTGKSGKGKAEERSGTAEMWQSGSAKSPAKGQLSRVSFNEEREVKNFQAFTSQLEDDHCAANFPSPYPSPGFSSSGAASRSGGPAAHSPMRPFDRAAKQPETRIEAISEIGSVQAVSTTESPPLRSAKSSPGPHQRTYYLSSPGSSNAESSAYSEKRSWRSFKLSFYGNKDNASPGPEPVRRSRSAASRDSELADPHALAMDVAAAARALESPSVGDSASPELHTRSRAVLASPRPGDLASLSSWDSSAFRNSLAAEDLEDATSTDSSSTVDYVICRICEDRVPSIILQEHNTVCTKIESSDIRIKSLASQPSVDARLTKLANYLEAMPHSHDPDILRVAHWARSAAALQPDNTGVPINRCQTCYKALEMMLHQGTMEGTMSVDVDALGRRVKSQIHAKVAELELAMSSIATGSPCSTPHSPHISMSINDFEIIKPISRGAFGRVYLARKKATQDLFAIKVMRKHDLLRKNMVESVKNERNILATTSNPFVVRFYYSFQSPTNLYIVMEYVSGGDCFSLLRNMGCLSEDDARVYVAETVLALEYCHAQGIVHRDLKPDNLLISDQGRIKLTDFGLSVVGVVDRATDYGGKSTAAAESSMENIRSLEHSVFSEASEGSDGTSMGSGNPAIASTSAKVVLSKEDHRRAVGTPDYLAPELLLGIGHTPAVDWWSLGAILFEFVVGIPPFNADSPQAIFQNILDLDIDWPDESNLKEDERMSPECRDLISKLLVRNPEERLGSRGATDIKLHPWFKSIDWSSLTHQKAAGTAPFIPEFENELDTSYFCAKPVSQHSLANDIFTENSTRLSEGSDDCSASPIKNRADSRRESRRSNLGRSHSKRHSPGSFRDGLDATLDLEPGPGNNPEASTNSIPSEVMGCGSTTEGSLATADTMSFSSAESEQEYLNRMASVRELTVPGEDYSGHECLTSPTSGPSWDNFSYKNLDNLAESNLSLHDALVRSGSVSGPNTGRFLGGLSREYSDPNFAPHLRDLNGSRDSRDG